MCADEAREVDDTNGVDGPERWRWCGESDVGVEIGGVVPPEVTKRRVQKMIELVLVAQAEACRDSLERGAGVGRKWPGNSLVWYSMRLYRLLTLKTPCLALGTEEAPECLPVSPRDGRMGNGVWLTSRPRTSTLQTMTTIPGRAAGR